jgi:hypothetical protein
MFFTVPSAPLQFFILVLHLLDSLLLRSFQFPWCGGPRFESKHSGILFSFTLRRSVKKFRNSFTPTVWCNGHFYVQVLQEVTRCNRNSGFCITVTRRAHRLLCSNYSRRQAMYSPDLCLSDFWLYRAPNNRPSREHVLQQWRALNRMRLSSSGWFLKHPSACTSYSGRMNGCVCARACVCKGSALKLIM